jgi:hypothetical protein
MRRRKRARTERNGKRAEGLKRAQLMKQSGHQETDDTEDVPDTDFLESNT